MQLIIQQFDVLRLCRNEGALQMNTWHAIGAHHARRPRLPLARYTYTYTTLLLFLAVESRLLHVLCLRSVVFKFNDFVRAKERAYFVFKLQVNVQFIISNILGS